MLQISSAETDLALVDALHTNDALALMAEVGSTKPFAQVSQGDKKEVIDAPLHLFIKVKAVMDQF